jgi:hypothetical protein
VLFDHLWEGQPLAHHTSHHAHVVRGLCPGGRAGGSGQRAVEEDRGAYPPVLAWRRSGAPGDGRGVGGGAGGMELYRMFGPK